MNEKSYNGISMAIGIIATIIACLLYAVIISTNDPMYLWGGILFIIGFLFFPGLRNVPIQHIEVLKLFGKRREDIRFKEGWRWILWFIMNTEDESAKIKMIDVPPLIVMSKNKVPMETNVQIFYQIVNPAAYLDLEEEVVNRGLISRAEEANRAFIISHTDNQNLGAEGNIQKAIEDTIDSRTREKWGINITSVDVKSVLPTKEILEEYEKDKKKYLRVKRFASDMKKIKKEAPEVTDDTLVNTTQVVEGIVEKKIEEKKTTFKLDVEKNITDFLTNLVPKKKR